MLLLLLMKKLCECIYKVGWADRLTRDLNVAVGLGWGLMTVDGSR